VVWYTELNQLNCLSDACSIKDWPSVNACSGAASSKVLVGHNLREVMGVLMMDGKIVHV